MIAIIDGGRKGGERILPIILHNSCQPGWYHGAPALWVRDVVQHDVQRAEYHPHMYW